MTATRTVPLDLVIFGGGAAGLWLLDAARRTGLAAVLLEAHQLGSGQTIASQGIIHGGLKYTLSGLLTPSAQAIADMPLIWRRCLAGEHQPDLAAVRRRADFCHLWRSTSLSGMLAMVGARAGLRVSPRKLDRAQRPAVLAACRGVVARLDEQVIEPASFLQVLASRHRDVIAAIDRDSGLEFDAPTHGRVRTVRLINPATGDPLDLQPRHVVLAAGAGNAQLAETLQLPNIETQRRPLHMVLMRGPLPTLNGHCVEGAATRLTITTTADSTGRTVWQVGGQVAELGNAMSPPELIAHTRREIIDVLPGLDLAGVEWRTYHADRAEAATSTGSRPDDAIIIERGNVLMAFPTKLALAPRLAERVLASIEPARDTDRRPDADPLLPHDWPRPAVALPPWETDEPWFLDNSAAHP